MQVREGGGIVTYPKKIMKTSELVALGYTYRYLMRMAHVEGQKYAKKLPGGRHLYWDTEKFEKAQEKLAVR